MKKLLLLLAVLALLLAGCGTNDPGSVTTTTAPPETTVKPGLYDPQSDLEILTSGAVKCFTLDNGTYTSAALMGEDLLLFSGYDFTTLTVVTGDNFSAGASTSVNCFLSPEEPYVQVSENGIGYFDEQDQAMVFLDNALQEVSRVSLPEDADSTPALSPDLGTVYYCAGNQVRALDIQSGISRLVKEQNCVSQLITGIYRDGTVLCCSVVNEDGGHTSVYLSTETGQTLYSGSGIVHLQTDGSCFFASFRAGNTLELIFGLTEGQEMVLEPRIYGVQADAVLACGGAVTTQLTNSGCTLDYYDLSSGLRTASLELPAADTVVDLAADPARNVLWFLYYDAGSGTQSLCCWDPSRSVISDDTVYTHPRYTDSAPDTEGLARCQAEAQRISEAYGVQILLWQDALSVTPADYDYTAEHLTSACQRGLEQLETALAKFPDGFLSETAKQSTNGTITIALVRAIEGDPLYDTLDSVDGLQYWLGGKACIGLALGDKVEQNAIHELFHVIETRVYASTVTYDDWASLNPKGFTYDYDYIANQNRTDDQYLEGGNRAFIDTYSMSFPREDRARLFEYAMMDGNGDYFTSGTMQKKLTKLCTGIRKAYGLQKYEEILPWEQYLEEPLTP